MTTPPRLETGKGIPITNDGSVSMAADLVMRANRITRLGAPIDPDDAARLADVGGGGGGGGGWNYIFDQLATQDPAKNVYSSWADLCAHIGTLSQGVQPIIQFQRDFTIPLAGMPASGWYMASAKLTAFTFVTGAVTATIEDGAKLDTIAGWSDGLTLAFQPSVVTDTINWTTQMAQYPGLPSVLFVGRGAAYHSTGAVAPITGPGTGQYIVLASNEATFRAGPPEPQALVNITGADIFIESQQFSGYFGSLPDGYLIGNGNLVRQVGLETQLALIPGFTGAIVLTVTAKAPADRIVYDDALAPAPFAPLGATDVQAAIDALKNPSKVIPSASPFPPGTWDTSDPASIDEAIQRMAAAIAGLLGGPIP